MLQFPVQFHSAVMVLFPLHVWSDPCPPSQRAKQNIIPNREQADSPKIHKRMTGFLFSEKLPTFLLCIMPRRYVLEGNEF